MKEHHINSSDRSNSQASLYETFGTLRHIQRPFSLLSESEIFGSDVQEWTTTKKPERIITFRGGTLIEELHDFFEDNNVRVLSKRVFRKDIVLEVPEGAKSMRNVTGFIERDPDNYSILFQLLGEQLRAIHQSGAGFPSGNWVDQFVYHPDSSEEHGARVVFLPPYKSSQLHVDVGAQVYRQLADTTNLKETTITQLMWEVHDGWNRGA